MGIMFWNLLKKYEPERALMMAILKDTIISIRSGCKCKKIASGEIHPRARFCECCEDVEWVLSPESEYVFSFRNICSVFGFDPEYIRKKIAELLPLGMNEIRDKLLN